MRGMCIPGLETRQNLVPSGLAGAEAPLKSPNAPPETHYVSANQSPVIWEDAPAKKRNS